MHLLFAMGCVKNWASERMGQVECPSSKNSSYRTRHTETQLVTLPNECLQGKHGDITLPAKAAKAMFFPVVMYRCESWTIKKAESWISNAFELWCWRRLLRVPWTARRSNQSILKEINPEYSLGGLMLKLKLQYFGHLMWRANWLEKTVLLGRLWKREKGIAEDEMVRLHQWLNGQEFEQTLGDSEGQGSLACCSPCGHKVGHNLETEQQQREIQDRVVLKSDLGKNRTVWQRTWCVLSIPRRLRMISTARGEKGGWHWGDCCGGRYQGQGATP